MFRYIRVYLSRPQSSTHHVLRVLRLLFDVPDALKQLVYGQLSLLQLPPTIVTRVRLTAHHRPNVPVQLVNLDTHTSHRVINTSQRLRGGGEGGREGREGEGNNNGLLQLDTERQGGGEGGAGREGGRDGGRGNLKTEDEKKHRTKGQLLVDKGEQIHFGQQYC